VSSQDRIALKEDSAWIKEVIDVSFPRFYRYFAWHSVQDLSEPTLIHEVNGEVAGFAKLIHFEVNGLKYGCILWIAVHPRFRHRCIASALTQASLRRFRAGGVRSVFASTQRGNVGALSTLGYSGVVQLGFLGLYRFFGWRVFGFFRSIWFAPFEVVLMSGPYF
jgi:ribosomal protein S18 acetylase RimI-like enzyme